MRKSNDDGMDSPSIHIAKLDVTRQNLRDEPRRFFVAETLSLPLPRRFFVAPPMVKNVLVATQLSPLVPSSTVCYRLVIDWMWIMKKLVSWNGKIEWHRLSSFVMASQCL